ncbi:ImmA/IrrE family metallo-endopeptidase [Terrabacter terrigena]|uniref:ImmA/IrrE family metallo-endopeptidase n=1 Tax=Terrabacter terrigena TaxID=574718 RepID=A0ABW3N0J1_9MICO
MATEVAPVTPTVLRWARESVGATVADAAKRAGVTEDRLLSWEAGEAEPTLAKLRSLAKLYQRPLAVFFLDEPPREFDAMRDFRRLPDTDESAWSRPLHKTYRRAVEQQEIMAELLRADDIPVGAKVPLAAVDEHPEEAGSRARAALHVTLEDQRGWRNPDVALKGWLEALEEAGVLVLRTSEVASAEMRGFSMPGEVPVVMINATDPPRAQIFTALHEFAHLMLHAEGLCDLIGSSTGTAAQVETWCNAVAAATLMPREPFLAALGDAATYSNSWEEDVIGQLSERWVVSREAVVRRLLSLNLTSATFYQQKRDEYRTAFENWRAEEKLRRRGKSGGPPPYRMAIRDRGRPYVRLVLDAYQRNAISTSSLSRLLALRTKHIPDLEREVS